MAVAMGPDGTEAVHMPLTLDLMEEVKINKKF
jgi:hypothetical protein